MCNLLKYVIRKICIVYACIYAYICLKLIKPILFISAQQCVEHVHYDLSQYTHGEKYVVSFLRQNCIINKRDAANPLHKIYDKNSRM